MDGRIVASDGRQGVPCTIEVNSASSPFYAPDGLEAKTGERFEWSCAGDDTIDAVYAAVRCDGYELSLASQLSVRCTRRLNVGDIVVRPSAKRDPSASGPAGAAQQ